MQYDQTIITPKGQTVHIRNGVASDGSAVLENFNLTHAETDYLLSYPDENHFDAEQESQYLEKKATSPNEIELIAFVNGKVAGTAGIDAIGAQYKVAHRAEFGISILKEYWGLGIGQALMDACMPFLFALSTSDKRLSPIIITSCADMPRSSNIYLYNSPLCFVFPISEEQYI